MDHAVTESLTTKRDLSEELARNDRDAGALRAEIASLRKELQIQLREYDVLRQQYA